jgi:F-type H+-transporting ATPase subunit gamma
VTALRLPELQARIHSLSELSSVVGAMRSLSAVRAQQARGTLDAIREYTAIVGAALARSFMHVPSQDRAPDTKSTARTTVVAFGSEHGFVGGFNARVLDCAAARVGTGGDRLLVVGTRGALVAAERRLPSDWTCPMASYVGGIQAVATRVASEIARESGELAARVVLVYTRSVGASNWRVVEETLIPCEITFEAPSAQVSRVPPISNLGPEELFDKLVEQLVFARLTRAASESFACENSARLAAMAAAHENIETKLAELDRLENEGRQEEVTTELLDIVTGADAMRDSFE